MPRSPQSIRTRIAVALASMMALTVIGPAGWQGSQSGSGWAAQQRPLARVDLSPVRVAVTSTGTKQLELSIDGPYQLRPVGSSRVLGRGDRLGTTTVTATANGLRIGSTEYAVTRLEIVPSQSPSLWVNGHEYRGSLRLFRRSGGSLLAVNVLPLGEYLASVVDGEMPTSFGIEARKAQAIVARTYALDVIRSDEGDPDFDLFASTSSQKYPGFQYRDGSKRIAGESEASRQVVRDTTGMVCTYQGRLFRTYYSAACGGQTTSGSAVFSDSVSALKSVRCDYCRDATLYRWQTELSKSTLSSKLKDYFRTQGKSFDELRTITLVKGQRDSGLVVPEFDVRDGRQTLRVSAATLRRVLPSGTLNSPFFTVSDSGSKFVFTGRGHGHAVGLCQWGARGQAQAGRKAADIVRYYYQGATVVQLQ